MAYMSDPGCSNPADDFPHGNDMFGVPKTGPYTKGCVGLWTPSVYVCPSADHMTPENYLNDGGLEDHVARGNYAACWGAGYYVNKPAEAYNDGAFGVVMVRGWQKAGGRQKSYRDWRASLPHHRSTQKIKFFCNSSLAHA